MVGKHSPQVVLPRPIFCSQPSKRKGTRHRRMKLVTLSTGLMGKISVACGQAAHRQWLKRLEPGPCQNLLTKTWVILSSCNIQIASAVYST